MYQRFLQSQQREAQACFCLLIDPDKLSLREADSIVELSQKAGVDCFFIGGSLLVNDQLDALLMRIRQQCNIPLVLFPGSSRQLSHRADALLLLSLISGRNAELLIGKHVEAAPFLRASGLEIMPTGYMLIDGGVATSVSYMSNTVPIPANKNDIAACTALAGELLGLKLIYMDAGSGAQKPVSDEMIRTVAQTVSLPLIVGGGIQKPETAAAKVRAGAHALVVGNAIEKDPSLILDIAQAVHFP